MKCDGWAVVAVVAVVGALCECHDGEGGRFANLDRLLDRLGGTTTEQPAPQPGAAEGTTAAPEHHRRHWASWLRKNDKLDTEDEDDDDEEDYDEEEQQDVGNRKSYTISRTSTNWKWPSTRRTMDKSWTTYRSGISIKPTESESWAQNEAYAHNLRMAQEGGCRWPKLKVIRVSDHYPSPNKVYLPACTQLHQCAQDTGCCSSPRHKCGPKHTERVELYFYTTYVVSSQIRSHHPTPTVEKLPFYNHTECECQDRADEMPRDTDPLRFTDQLATRNPGCKCPSEYTVRQLANGSCACDCFDKQRDCTKYKKGKEYFNHQDRLCIETGSCTVPTCDFGVYLRRNGRCPRKHEKFRSWPRYH